ncbi:MAG: AAA-like domain-containing protein [Plectolyngbya sp. WJT66-NPBG17]|jgi:hypothetical protein|nr:AAA-like domain-containing protein [Plectolyngbya sp. WJT66-NPBG17]MBW4527040.1 AAA-like domain-containing protein [Phormidium tanganyikae FI6-MK23]
MDVESAISLADELIFKSSGKSMNDLQRIVFRGAWQGKSFTEIHQDCRDRCGLDHLMRNVGPELWKLLSEATGTKVTKNYLQGAFSKLRTESVSDQVYVDRVPFEQECYAEILKPGALIRIRAAQDMGKTWLMEQVLSHARQNGYRTQAFNFELCDSTVLTDLNKFSQWFCASIAHAIGLPNRLSDYWVDIFGCNYNSTLYFENYLLQQIETPIVLALDKVDIVFEHSAIATDFCALLRGWNQRAMQGDEIGAIWKKLRLIIVHSTEVYGNLDINHSPIGGVGLIVKLPEFNREQVQELLNRYQLDWKLDRLMNLVGGHPYLIQHAIKQKLSLDQLLQSAATESGIYSDHLRRHWAQLQQTANLAIAFKQVISSIEPVPLDPLQAFKLESMGLVHLQGNAAIPRCELYRQYFLDRL